MLLFYIRHGDPIYNPDSLSPLGHKQADALSRRLISYGIDEIYSSDSVRARETAEATAKLLRKEIQLCPWAHENLVWEELAVYSKARGGNTWACFDEEYRVKFNSAQVRALGAKWYDHPDFAHTKFKNAITRIDRETDNFLLSLGYRHDRENCRYTEEKKNDKRIAFFAHEGFGWAFLSSVLDIPYAQFSTHFSLGHSSMTVIEFKKDGEFAIPRILTYSNDSHLYKEGLLSGYGHVGGVRF